MGDDEGGASAACSFEEEMEEDFEDAMACGRSLRAAEGSDSGMSGKKL